MWRVSFRHHDRVHVFVDEGRPGEPRPSGTQLAALGQPLDTNQSYAPPGILHGTCVDEHGRNLKRSGIFDREIGVTGSIRMFRFNQRLDLRRALEVIVSKINSQVSFKVDAYPQIRVRGHVDAKATCVLVASGVALRRTTTSVYSY